MVFAGEEGQAHLGATAAPRSHLVHCGRRRPAGPHPDLPNRRETPIAPAWASVLLAVALLFIAIDRFFGFSTAWMRYISAELQLKQLKETFELDSEAMLASLQGQPPSPDQV